MVLLISVTGGRFPRAVREPPRRKRLRGLTWTRFSRRKDVGRTVICPTSLRRVTAGAHVFLAAFHYNHLTYKISTGRYILAFKKIAIAIATLVLKHAI